MPPELMLALSWTRPSESRLPDLPQEFFTMRGIPALGDLTARETARAIRIAGDLVQRARRISEVEAGTLRQVVR